MGNGDEIKLSCGEFEESLTDYLDGTLNNSMRKAAAVHALQCPLCHALLNEVKTALEVCHEIAVPKQSMTGLEARILSMTMPETAMACQDFEAHLTDYLDGFLPATVFHRWERHAVLCDECTDLPGAVVRSIAACYSYKTEELPLPAGLHEKILRETLGTAEAATVVPSAPARLREWLRGLVPPLSIPQLAPVAMMLMFVVMVLTQIVSADGSIGSMYQKSFELAGQTYRQGANVVLGEKQIQVPSSAPGEPIRGEYVNQGENR